MISIVVGFSGGRDSHVLLDVLHALKQIHQFNLRAIHVHHGLQPDAELWVSHCQTICDDYAISLEIIYLNLKIPKGESIEATARNKRYAAFKKSLKANEILVTAHHADDQAETFLLQLLRGAGTTGLAGIAPWKSLGKGFLARPLLNTYRSEIEAYAQAKRLHTIEDKTNEDPRFTRNYLRAAILPLLRKINPSVSMSISRSAQHCANTQNLLDEYLNQDLKRCLGKEKNTLALSQFRLLSQLRQEYVLRHWLRLNHACMPSQIKLKEILQQMLNAKADANPCVSWGAYQIKRFQGLLYFLNDNLPSSFKEIIWRLPAEIALEDGSRWRAKLVKGQGISLKKLSSALLKLKCREGGERVKPAGSKNSRALKKLLQEMRVPPWERTSLPLFYQNEDLVAVGDLLVCENWQAGSEEEGWMIEKLENVGRSPADENQL